jgi:nitric oxide reductase subunit B
MGVWNFVGAGVFGFLINLPIVSCFEAGTMLTPNHAHAAFMGVFGMLAVALMVFAFRQVTPEEQWRDTEKYIRVSFWGLNVGLAMMIAGDLFSGGVLQLYDVLQNGYWHARTVAFGHSPLIARARMGAASGRSHLHWSWRSTSRNRGIEDVSRSPERAARSTGKKCRERSRMSAPRAWSFSSCKL